MRKKKNLSQQRTVQESRVMVQYPLWPAPLISKNRILINSGQKGRNGRK